VPAESLPDIDRQAFAGEQVEDRERAESSAVRQFVRDEVHAPDVIAIGRRSPLLAMHRGRVSPRALAP
jgi:hypothetical protein